MSILKKKSFRIFAVLVAVILLALGACAIYLGNYYPADAQALAALEDTQAVTCEEWADGTLAFLPENANTGLIFYPGGKVEHTAYVPLMQVLAAHGVLCVLIEMPFRLAVLDVNAADGVQEKYPQIEHWYIGGHSLGGSMAASYLESHAADFDGLVLLASYSTADLRECGLSVLSVFGSEDGVLNREKYDTYRKNLPTNTREVVLEGGNHANFGAYGTQKGDGKARMPPAEQIARTAQEMAALFGA